MTTKIGVLKVHPLWKNPSEAEVVVGVNRYTQASPSGKYLGSWAAIVIGPKELSTWKS